MSESGGAWSKFVEIAEPLQDITDRQRITMKLGEIERIVRALIVADSRLPIVRPDYVEKKIILTLEHIRGELLILSGAAK